MRAAIGRLLRLETRRDRKLAWSILASAAYVGAWAVWVAT